MNYLKITNDGELDSLGITLLGASVKQENSIGMFGSGLSYSVAYLLREGIDFRIYSGIRKVEIKCIPKVFRDQKFDVITVDGQESSITTAAGPKWSVQDIIREIYCNALDEGGAEIIQTEGICEGESGKTTIYITVTDEIITMLQDWKEYFCSGLTVLAETMHGSLLTPNTGGKVYYRGIWASDLQNDWSYSYNSNLFQLDESRKADSWQAGSVLAQILGDVQSEKVVKNILEGKYEEQRIIARFGTDFSLTWQRLLRQYDGNLIDGISVVLLSEMERRNMLVLEPTFLNYVCDKLALTPYIKKARGHAFKPCKLRSTQKARIIRMLSILEKANYSIPYEIIGGQFATRKIIAMALPFTKQIVLNAQCIDDQSDKQLISTLLEEYFHISEQLHDETREFETFILDELAQKCIEIAA